MLLRSALLAIVSVLCATVLAEAAPPSYRVTDIGTLGSGSWSFAYGISPDGQAVGYSYTTGTSIPHAFLWSGGTMKDLGTLGGTASYSYAVNASGTVTGSSGITATDYHAFLWAGGSMIDLGTLAPFTSSGGHDINSAGQIVGTLTETATTDQQAFLYSNGSMTELGALPGMSSSNGEAINDNGMIVGESRGNGYAYRAFSYLNGVMTDLGTLAGGGASYAKDVNLVGQIVGYATTGAGTRAYLYSGEAMKDLGTLGTDSYAYGINDSGLVVGESRLASGTVHGFLYSEGQMIDLNSLISADSGWLISSADGINDAGQIVGGGRTPTGQWHAVLLTPTVPEPATLGLWCAAAAGIAAMRRKRARRTGCRRCAQ